MRCLVVALAVFLAPFCRADAEFYPIPLNDANLGMDFVFPDEAWKTLAPYRSAGMVIARFSAGRAYYGSGVVAVNRKLLFSCAHVAYDRGRWASGIGFARAYSRQQDPADSDFVYARGFRNLAGYAPHFNDYDFEYDFTVAYAFSGFGEPVARHPQVEAKSALLAGRKPKMILGYPSTIDYFERQYEEVPGFSYLHRTGPFTANFDQVQPLTGSFLEVDGVTTGPGNSGGPVFVEENGQHLLAGILVSGNDELTNAGIFALNAESDLAVQSALGAANTGTARTIPFGRPMSLRDGVAAYHEVRFNFSTMPPSASAVVFRWTVAAANIQHVEAMLRSPDGERVALPKQALISGLDLSSQFSGLKADGIWTLFIRDAVPGGRSVLRRASLSLTSRWPD